MLLALELQIRDLRSHIASQFNDLREIPYRLHSVFIHRGFHNSGHYWIYIYDFANHLWRKYNDGYVTEIKDVKEIFEQEPGDRPATPYFLVYVLDKSKVDLVDSVCRDVETQTEERQDTVMEDCSEPEEVQKGSQSYTTINPSLEYATINSYDSQGWTHGEGLGGNGAWQHKEAEAFTDW